MLSRNRIKEEKIVQYHVVQAFFTKLTQDRKCSLCFTRVVGRSLPSGVGLLKILNLYRKFQYTGNFKVIQYLGTIVGSHCQWLEFHIKVHGMAGKQCIYSAQKNGKRSLFGNFGCNFNFDSVDTLLYLEPGVISKALTRGTLGAMSKLVWPICSHAHMSKDEDMII